MSNYLPRTNTGGGNYNAGGNYLSTNNTSPPSDQGYYNTQNQANYANQTANYMNTATPSTQFGTGAPTNYTSTQSNYTATNQNYLPPPPTGQTNYTNSPGTGQSNYTNTSAGYTGAQTAQNANYMNNSGISGYTGQTANSANTNYQANAARPVTTQYQASPTQSYQAPTTQYQRQSQYPTQAATTSPYQPGMGASSPSFGATRVAAAPSNPGSVTYSSADGSFHSYNDNEKQRFVEYINAILANDPDLRGIIPINSVGEDIFRLVGSTNLLWFV